MSVDFGLRYDAKRAAGISEIRSDGSKTSRQTDVQAGAAEKFAADFFKVECNEEVYSNHGDGGKDFMLGNASVDVVHLGMLDDGPRMTGNLIVNPHEPQRHADIYVVVRGSIETTFEIVGWYPHTKLVARPKVNFGYGDRYACPIKDLYEIDILVKALAT